MKLKNWHIVLQPVNPYTAPECSTVSLQGTVYGHPYHEDGTEVVTSSIVGKRGELVVTKSGNEYELLDVNLEHEAMYPQSRERVFANLKEI